MLSNILAQLFRVGYIFGMVALIVSLTTQVMNKPINVDLGDGGKLTIGNTGLLVKAKRYNNNDWFAPDSIIKYKVLDSNHQIGESGTLMIGYSKPYKYINKQYDQILNAKRDSGQKLELDTVVHLIGEEHQWSSFNNNDSTYGTDPGFVRNHFFRLYFPMRKISEEGGLTEELRIMPANTWQRIFFVLFDAVNKASFVLLMLFLSRLFYQFSKRQFFTATNISLVKRAGWLLLVPPAAGLIMYYGFLVNIHPVKLYLAGDTDTAVIANYEIRSYVDWTLVFLGVGLLVLSIIFKDGLKMKEEEEYTL